MIFLKPCACEHTGHCPESTNDDPTQSTHQEKSCTPRERWARSKRACWSRRHSVARIVRPFVLQEDNPGARQMRRSALSGHPECWRVLERAFFSVRVFPARRGSGSYGASARRSTSSRAADRTASRHATCLEAQLVRRPLRSRLLGPRTRPWSPSELLRRPPEHQSDVRATGASPRR